MSERPWIGFRLTSAVLTGAVILAFVCGCGGGGDGDTATAEVSTSGKSSITKAEFIRRGDAICRRALEEQEATVAAAEAKVGHGKVVSDSRREQLLISLTPLFFERKTEELAKLPVPEGDEAKVRAIIVGYEQGIREIKAKPSSIVRGTPFVEGRKAASRYGLSNCA